MGNYDSAPSYTATADPDVQNAGSILAPSNLFCQHQLLGSRSSALQQLIQSALSWHLDSESSARKLLPYPSSAHVKREYRGPWTAAGVPASARVLFKIQGRAAGKLGSNRRRRGSTYVVNPFDIFSATGTRIAIFMRGSGWSVHIKWQSARLKWTQATQMFHYVGLNWTDWDRSVNSLWTESRSAVTLSYVSLKKEKALLCHVI